VSKQPEALRLADRLTAIFENAMWVNYGAISKSTAEKAADELRRQHAEIEQSNAQVFLQMKWKTDAQNENERLLEINAELLEALKRLVYQDSSGNWRVVQLNGQVTEIVSAAIAKAEKVKP
jgi:ABC-type cobalamin transport system ATPase subunit